MLKETEVLIVGAGPAGSACAADLQKYDVDFILLDKQPFPRDKTCAGWITPGVFRSLNVSPGDYPYGLTTFHHFHVHLRNQSWIIPVQQYAIRRREFDLWLLEREGLVPEVHHVREIIEDKDGFVVDNRYRCRYLVGAGGDRCPVARTFFGNERLLKEKMVVALEKEFRYAAEDKRCHLWFRQPGLPGYAWYVPKTGGYLNIGLGAFADKLYHAGPGLKTMWDEFLNMLNHHGLYRGDPVRGDGYRYRIRTSRPVIHKGNVWITGDAAGLATRDMGEGIGPAIESGIAVARAIASRQNVDSRKIRKRSFSAMALAAQVLTGKIKRDSTHFYWARS